MKRLLTIITATVCSACLHGQITASHTEDLRTVQVKPNGEWGEPPVMLMHGGGFMEISFDDLQHNYVRYTYKITHCNADWKPSDMYEGDYMSGINGAEVIDDYTQSMNTEMMYNHYRFILPNENIRLLISGNYRVDIYEDGEDDPVATACFSIVDPKIGIDMSISANTDIDAYQSHQQVDFNINYATYPCTNPEAEFIPLVVQNRRWDNRAYNLFPNYLRSNQLVYTHNSKLIFEAGNEYRRFEILDRYVPTMRVDNMKYKDGFYHAEIFTDEQRINYKYDQDQNGRYLVRNGDDYDNETESDYFYTHFSLDIPELTGGKLYLHGDLTDNGFSDGNEMQYDPVGHRYELSLPLKQGSYNYQYLFVPNGSDVGQAAPTEGSFHQTENEYYIYVYHRAFGSRYDQLVGFRSLKYKAN